MIKRGDLLPDRSKIKESNKKYYENKIEERAGLTLTAEIKQDRKKLLRGS